MSADVQRLQAAVAALEAQRATLGDAVVDLALSGLRAELAALTAAPAPQALKQVSILFLDVVGSTTLSQQLDPEDVSAVMDGLLARGTAIVEAHHGRVLQYAGDNLLAAFGAAEAHEDDAERAVRCGLALLALGRRAGNEVRAAHGHDGFDVRVGIHTGGVLLGGGVDAEGTIRGMAVNVAARMEQTAPAGALRISHDTYALVRGLFDVLAQPPLQVKGVDEPVRSYLVQRAKPRSFRIVNRGIEGVATRMIGRDAELARLQQAFLQLFSQPGFRALTVVADAGLGKSRLLTEFEAWAEARPERFLAFRGRAMPHTLGQPFGLLRDILAWRLQIQDDDSLEAARAKLEAGIVPLFAADDGPDLAEAHAHVLGHLIGIEYRDSRHVRGILDDPRQIRSRALHTATQLLRRVADAAGAPAVLLIEDLQWADAESLDFLEQLGDSQRDMALLLLGFSRPGLFERRPDWGQRLPGHDSLTLLPLDADESRRLGEELLQRLPAVPPALQALLSRAAEGNPFYMEELVKMLIDQGAIRTGDEAWQVDTERLQATQVPATLTGVLQARLDGLPAAERLALQEASVIGPVFWDQALQALDGAAADTLPALLRRALVRPRADAPAAGLREFAFHHALLHQVTYALVLKRVRRELHARLAHWFSGLSGLRANDFLAVTAEHYERAGDDANAAEFHARAAEHAATRFAHEVVLHHVQAALGLLDRLHATAGSAAQPQGPLRWRLLKTREAALDLLGRRPEQRQDLDGLEALAEALADDTRRAYAAYRRSSMAMRTADWATMRAAAERGIASGGRAGDDELRLRCQRLLALAQAYLGDANTGRRTAEQALAEARAIGHLDLQSFCLNALAVIADGFLGDPVAGLAQHRAAVEINRATGNRRNEVIGLGNMGACWMDLGALEQARHCMEQSLQMARAHGDRQQECTLQCNLAVLLLWLEEPERALATAQSAAAVAVAVEARDRQAAAWGAAGHAELALGRPDAARTAFEAAQTLAQAIDHGFRHDAAAGLAWLALQTGDLAAALRAVAPLQAQLEAGGQFDGAIYPRQIDLVCYRVMSAAMDPRAEAWLARGHDQVQQMVRRISDAALRASFLERIPYHRELVAAWRARPGVG